MSYAVLLGLIGTLVGLIRALPQLIALIRSQKANGVSLDAALTSSFVSFGWAIYGVMTDQLYVSLATGTSGTVFALISILSIRFGRSLNEIRIALIWFIVMILSGSIFGSIGLGAILPVSVLASNIPQLWVAYREANLADLSLGTWILSFTDGLVWETYSIIQDDPSIMVFGFFQMVTSGAIVLFKILYISKQKSVSSSTNI